jgi:hypothetical protein
VWVDPLLPLVHSQPPGSGQLFLGKTSDRSRQIEANELRKLKRSATFAQRHPAEMNRLKVDRDII